jgi:hypothetical protein
MVLVKECLESSKLYTIHQNSITGGAGAYALVY